MRERATAQHGFTMVEVLVATLIVAIGLSVSVVALTVPQKRSLGAQREAQAGAIAQQELEAMAARPWADLGLTAAPGRPASDPDANDPTDPRFWLDPTDPTKIRIENSYSDGSKGQLSASESLVAPVTHGLAPVCFTGGSAGAAGAPSGTPACSATSSGEPPATVYRFISYAPQPACTPTLADGTELQNLLNSLLSAVTGLVGAATQDVLKYRLNLFCSSTQAVKRATVAVVMPAAGDGAGPLRPVYLSTEMPNPDAAVFDNQLKVGSKCLSLTCSLL